MKPDGVRRSVRSTHLERAAGDAPNMGRVARIPGTGLPKEKRRKRKQKGTGRRHNGRRSRTRVVATWSLCIGALAAISLGIAIWQGLKFNTNTGEPVVRLAGGAEVGAFVNAPRVPSLSEKDALALVKNGLAIRDPDRVSECFRHGDLPPAEEASFLAGLEARDGKIDHYEWIGNIDANGLAMDGVLVFFTSDGLPRNRLAALIADSDGRWKIDFDAFARVATAPWEAISEGRFDVAKVRVLVSADNYYNGSFKDESEWICVGFASPDSEVIFNGYCKRRSPQAEALKWIFAHDSRLKRAVLEIRRPESAESRQVVISSVLAEDWVTGDSSFDERFK